MTIRISFRSLTLLILLAFAAFLGVAFAEENSSEMAKKYNIQFPISELGNCTSFSSCKAYCDDETHKDSCIAFAKKKGFYKDSEQNEKNASLLKDAQTELGCTSETSCRAVCEKEENIDKCSAFAKKHNLGTPQGNPGDRAVLQKAKELLGCDSESSCRTVCENPENQEKCSTFAKQTGLGGGIKHVGPGGCNSEESCRTYCESHMDECRQFGGDHQGSEAGENRKGPGGCDSEESCKVYCTSHPDECKQFSGERGSETNRQSGPGGCNSEESCKKYCQEHPTECGIHEGNDNGAYKQINPEEYCQKNPEQCQQHSGSYQQPPSQSSDSLQYNQEQRNYYQSQTNQQQPVERQEAQPQQSVQGAATGPSLWEKLLLFLLTH